MSKEIWKLIPNTQYYEASSLGRIRSIDHVVPAKAGSTRLVRGLIKKLQVHHKGYLITTLSMDGKLATYTVHQLVALTFLPNFKRGTEIHHIDGIRTNNRVSNLEVANPPYNQVHTVRLSLAPKAGTSKYHNVTYIKNPNARSKWAACIWHNSKNYGWRTFATEIEAAKHADALLDEIGDTVRKRNFP